MLCEMMMWYTLMIIICLLTIPLLIFTSVVVWYWGFLCIKSIKEDSIFEKTALKWTDQITAINDIDCQEMHPEQFAKAVKELPYDVTLTVLRRKQRWIGDHK